MITTRGRRLKVARIVRRSLRLRTSHTDSRSIHPNQQQRRELEGTRLPATGHGKVARESVRTHGEDSAHQVEGSGAWRYEGWRRRMGY
jgi:hypothetical protein